jgi:hypothetical protein
MKLFIEALNDVATNIWGMLVLALGVLTILACMKFKQDIAPGTLIVGGGLAIVQHKSQ